MNLEAYEAMIMLSIYIFLGVSIGGEILGRVLAYIDYICWQKDDSFQA